MKCSTLLLLACGLMFCPTARAQEAGDPPAASPEATAKEWYYGPTPKQKEPKSPGRLRAETRAQQRLARLSSMRWYGFTPGRPTAAGMPFTTMYSPAMDTPRRSPLCVAH